MKYTVTKPYSFSYKRKRYLINPGDELILIKDHLPELIPFGDKARYKVFSDMKGREAIVFSSDFKFFKELN